MNLDLHGLEIRHAAELLVGLKQSVLRKRAIAAGADEGELDAADDALDTKACLAVLLLQKYAGVLTKSWQLSTDPAAASLLLRMDLGAIVKMSALRKRAIQDGVTAEALEEADDAEDMRAALIEAIVVHAAKTVVTATLPAAAKEVATSTEDASGAAQSHADSVAVVPADSLLHRPARHQRSVELHFLILSTQTRWDQWNSWAICLAELMLNKRRSNRWQRKMRNKHSYP